MERLLIATYNKVILWDKGQNTVWKGRASPEYHNFYGISWDEERIYVAEGGHTAHSTIHVFDKNLNRQGTLPLSRCAGDPHQIYWWDGKLYVASSAEDRIVAYGETFQSFQWKRSGESTLHVNSIWCDGERFYVVEHRKREMPKRVRIFDLDFSPIDCIELKEDGFIKKRPHGIHNVYIEDGILYTCSPRAIVRHNLSSGESRPVIPHRLVNEAHYVRGLARVLGRFFVGLSEVKVRVERGEGDSAVLVLNDDLTVDDVIPLKDTGGLNEIRAIDGPDLAHNQVRCPYR